MPEDFSSEVLLTKTPKRSPIVLRMIVLAFATLFGVYICFICLKQIRVRVDSKYILLFPNISNVEKCQLSGTLGKENFHLHFPNPKTYSRGECICNPVRFFAILSMQRSGSGWFETLLNSHLNVSSNGEIFSVKERRSNISAVLSTLDKVYNLDWYSSAAKNECSAAVGFKWMLNQGVMKYHNEIVDYFNRRGVSAIFLFRKNLLRRMISILANTYDQDTKQLNGTHRSHVHSKTEAKVLARYKPTINVTLLLPELKRTEEMAINALEYFNSTRHITLFYEDLVNNHTKPIDVQEFLGVPIRKLESHQVKIHTRPLPKQIANWVDVYNTLMGTKYDHFVKAG
ncbi:Sulfotransferase domain-containing protein [Cinnamomum micranthum f. kanehirae]|uniref:Sulfotransferase domain-containing protein n=1 Tax=Cinnamomum micranthum f. kanehirae TaxID=337451 RepID=A0A3S3Q0K9_9MAGN|nr:Sulfotransferase domain-containing protein [Cinnamomum micranthum f. kanehirae]